MDAGLGRGVQIELPARIALLDERPDGVRKPKSKVPFYGNLDQATVWRVPSPKMIMGGSAEPKQDHPAQKPVLLAEIPIRNHTKPGDAVYDPFLGSGTTLIAAERHARACYGFEIDPVYCDVIVARWERFSGRVGSVCPLARSRRRTPR